MKITTNNVPRDIIDGWQLSDTERAEFDYLNWAAIEKGEDSASFFRYQGQLYDLGTFWRTETDGWDGVKEDSFFSGTLVRYVRDDSGDYSVIVGSYCA